LLVIRAGVFWPGGAALRGGRGQLTHALHALKSHLPSQLSAWQQTRITAARAATWARNSWAATHPRNRTARPHAATGSARARR